MNLNVNQPTSLCPTCRAPVDTTDRYCRRCGAALGSLSARQPRRWDSPWIVLTLLFLVAGPFALPLLWFSRRFTAFWKIVLTLLVLAITAYIGWQVWQIYQQLAKSLQELQI
jgi:hypothetical protein